MNTDDINNDLHMLSIIPDHLIPEIFGDTYSWLVNTNNEYRKEHFPPELIKRLNEKKIKETIIAFLKDVTVKKQEEIFPHFVKWTDRENALKAMKGTN